MDLCSRVVIKGVRSKKYSAKTSWVGLHFQRHASGMWQHQEWPLDSGKLPNADGVLAWKHSPLSDATETWPGIPWYLCGILANAVLETVDLCFACSLFILKRPHEILCYWLCVGLAAASGTMPACTPKQFTVNQRTAFPNGTARAVQRAWLGAHHHMVRWR